MGGRLEERIELDIETLNGITASHNYYKNKCGFFLRDKTIESLSVNLHIVFSVVFGQGALHC